MKKFLPIIIIIALVAIVLCFAACGNDTIDDTITSMSNEMTTIMDNLTSIPDTSVTDLTDNITDNQGDITDNTAGNNGIIENTSDTTK